jgi:hypothetical protein
VGPGVRPAPPVAAGRHLASDLHRAPGPGRRERADHLGHQRRLHGVPGPPARRRARNKGSCRRAARCRHRRAGRPRDRTLARRPDHQAAPGRRTGTEAQVHRDHGRAAGRFPAVRARPEQGPCPASWARQAAHPARSRARRQGIRLTQEPCLPATARNPLHHPGQGRPGPQPQETRLARRPAGRSSTCRTTRLGTRPSAASTASKGTGPWPRGATSSRSATRRPRTRPSSLRPSTSGCDQHR